MVYVGFGVADVEEMETSVTMIGYDQERDESHHTEGVDYEYSPCYRIK